MNLHRTMRQCRLPVAVVSTFVLLCLMGFLYSPLHKHIPSKICPFTALDHAGFEEPAHGVVLPDPGCCTDWHQLALYGLKRSSTAAESTGCRAPPAWL